MIDEKIELSKRLAVVSDYIPINKKMDVLDAYDKSLSFDDLPDEIKSIILNAEKKRKIDLGIS